MSQVVAAEAVFAADEDYMGPSQLAFFRQELNRLRDEILHGNDERRTRVESRERDCDPLDQADAEQACWLETVMHDHANTRLTAVNAALARIEDGTYGWCEDSGEPIGIRRLLAQPTSTLSVAAQEYRERQTRLHRCA